MIIDIRPKKDYDEYHYYNSINIPKILLLSNPDIYLDKNKTYFLLCDEGVLSSGVSKILNALGYNTKSIDGGLKSLR